MPPKPTRITSAAARKRTAMEHLQSSDEDQEIQVAAEVLAPAAEPQAPTKAYEQCGQRFWSGTS